MARVFFVPTESHLYTYERVALRRKQHQQARCTGAPIANLLKNLFRRSFFAPPCLDARIMSNNRDFCRAIFSSPKIFFNIPKSLLNFLPHLSCVNVFQINTWRANAADRVLGIAWTPMKKSITQSQTRSTNIYPPAHTGAVARNSLGRRKDERSGPSRPGLKVLRPEDRRFQPSPGVLAPTRRLPASR